MPITNLTTGLNPETDPGRFFSNQEMADYARYAQESAKYQNDWNSAQTRQQMDFQKMMSDTAHQREVADLKAAGLNPVLSANHQGATTASGASAQAANPMQSVSGVVGAITSAQASMENARVSAAANLAVAQLQAQSAQLIARNQLSYDKWKTENYAGNMWQMISQLLNGNGTSASQLPGIARSAVQGIIGLIMPSKTGKNQNGYSHLNGTF